MQSSQTPHFHMVSPFLRLSCGGWWRWLAFVIVFVRWFAHVLFFFAGYLSNQHSITPYSRRKQITDNNQNIAPHQNTGGEVRAHKHINAHSFGRSLSAPPRSGETKTTPRMSVVCVRSRVCVRKVGERNEPVSVDGSSRPRIYLLFRQRVSYSLAVEPAGCVFKFRSKSCGSFVAFWFLSLSHIGEFCCVPCAWLLCFAIATFSSSSIGISTERSAQEGGSERASGVGRKNPGVAILRSICSRSFEAKRWNFSIILHRFEWR